MISSASMSSLVPHRPLLESLWRFLPAAKKPGSRPQLPRVQTPTKDSSSLKSFIFQWSPRLETSLCTATWVLKSRSSGESESVWQFPQIILRGPTDMGGCGDLEARASEPQRAKSVRFVRDKTRSLLTRSAPRAEMQAVVGFSLE